MTSQLSLVSLALQATIAARRAERTCRKFERRSSVSWSRRLISSWTLEIPACRARRLLSSAQ
jgi:hypothetical protein